MLDPNPDRLLCTSTKVSRKRQYRTSSLITRQRVQISSTLSLELIRPVDSLGKVGNIARLCLSKETQVNITLL